MKIAMQVRAGPFSAQASLTALHFAEAAVAAGHEVTRVFFSGDGVFNGNTLVTPPQDEIPIVQRWQRLHQQHETELILCISSALRHGVMDATEADRYDHAQYNLADGFLISGLGQLAEAAIENDRLITFGD